MSIEIKVDRVRESGLFYGGDRVHGTVEIRGVLDFPDYDDTKVNIIFAGSSDVWHAVKGHVYSDKATFFQVETVLFIGNVDLKRGASEKWAFSFTLPERTESNGGTDIKRKKRSDVFLMTPHLLPQSAALAGGGRHQWQGIVSYTLHARVSGKWGWREDRRALQVVPKPLNEQPSLDLAVQSKNFTHSSSRLLAEEANRKRSVGKWFSDKTASNTPKAVFTIKAKTSQTLTPGLPITIHMQLDYDTEKSNLPSLPELRLLEVKYEIFAKTELWGDEFMSTALSRELKGLLGPRDLVYVRNLQFDTHFLVHGQNIEVDKYKAAEGDVYDMYHITLDQALVPPFKTYNLARSYEAVVSFNFECGGKNYKEKFSWPLDIRFSENYIPPSQAGSGNDDSAAVKMVGGMALKGVALILSTVLS